MISALMLRFMENSNKSMKQKKILGYDLQLQWLELRFMQCQSWNSYNTSIFFLQIEEFTFVQYIHELLQKLFLHLSSRTFVEPPGL